MEKEKTEISQLVDTCAISGETSHCLHDRGHLFEYEDINSRHLSNMPKHPFKCDVDDDQNLRCDIPEKQRRWPTTDSELASRTRSRKEDLDVYKHCAIYHKPTQTINQECSSYQCEDKSKSPRTPELLHKSTKEKMFYLREEENNEHMWLNFDSELKPSSHLLLSPRNSNGSICSNRSSNADSAVDLLTPDEEAQSDYQEPNTQSVDWFKGETYKKPKQQLSVESGVELHQTFCKNIDVPAVVVSDHSGPCEENETFCDFRQLIDEQAKQRYLKLDREMSVESDDSRYSSTGMSCRSNSSASLTDLTDFDDPVEEILLPKPIKKVRHIFFNSF